MKANLVKVLAALVFIMPCTTLAEPAKIPDLKQSFLEIPWSDFKLILEKLQVPEPEPEPEPEKPEPPVNYSITSAEYIGALESGSAGFEFTLNFTVLEDEEWLEIPVLPSELAVEDIALDKKPALVRTEGGWHRVMLLSPGEHKLTGRFFVRPKNREGPRSINFPIPETPVTTMSFSVPEPGLSIEADPSNLNRVVDMGKSTLLEAVIPTTGRVAIKWGKKIEAQEAELRINAVVESLVGIGERLVRVDSAVRYEILHRGVSSFKMGLPKDVELVDVSGVGVVDWKARKSNERQILTVNLNYEAKGAYVLMVQYERKLPDATAEALVPVIETIGTSRETGYIGIAARTNVEVEVKEVSNLASVDVSNIPEDIGYRSSAPLIFAFKYIGHPWKLKLQATRHKDVEILTCTADRGVLHSFMTTEGELVTRAIFTVRNNREQFIRFELPEGARVFGTFRDNAPVRPARDAQGRILVPLEKSTDAGGRAKSFNIEITYMVQLSEMSSFRGAVEFEAPKTDVMTNDLEWAIYLPKNYRYKVKDATLEKKETSTVGFTDLLSSLDGDSSYMVSEKKADKWNKERVQVTANVQFDEKSLVVASLPVRFEVPSAGVLMDFRKTIIAENEPNGIELTYWKIPKITPVIKWGTRTSATLLVVLVVYILIRRRKKRDLPEGGIEL